MKRSLSGIKPTGSPHLGNYFGFMKPAIELQSSYDTAYFIANYHALTSVRDSKKLHSDTLNVAACFLASGYDAQKGILYRQSDVPQVAELTTILSNYVSVGDLTRAHAYKAAKDQGNEGTLNAGVFMYPVLMASDILIHDADVVPVGKDQVQHLEMARAIAARFNHHHNAPNLEDTLKEPLEMVKEEVAVVPGTDGRKMSKSYDNGIDPFATSDKELKKQIMAIVSDSKDLEDIKDPSNCNIVALYKLFATTEELQEMETNYRKGGYGYGHAKIALYDKVMKHFGAIREKYNSLLKNPDEIESYLEKGAERTRTRADKVLSRVKASCGLEK